jgi:hypothetical protein
MDVVGQILGRVKHPREAVRACAGGWLACPVSRADHFVPSTLVIGPDRLLNLRFADHEEPPALHIAAEGANTPASRIFWINAAGTGSGFCRRIERVVCIISNRTEAFSDMASSN